MTSVKTSGSNASSTQSPCYCLGARHRVITNCLECGYLLCEQDANPGTTILPNIQQQSTPSPIVNSNNYSSLFCPSCQVPCILPYSASEAKALYGTDSIETARYVRAYEMKDKLLQFDQEHAQRTRVYDAQGDYYNAAGNMSWLSEQERQRLEAVEKKRRELLTQRSRVGRKVNIVFNIAGQRVVDVDPYLDLDDDNEDDEDEYNEGSVSNKIEDKIESQRLLVCKAILDERDQGNVDAPSLPEGSSWAMGSLKDALVQETHDDTNVPETVHGLNPEKEGNEKDNNNDVILANGLENTSMQLQTTRAAETYRFMRQNLQQLVSSSSSGPHPQTASHDKEQHTKHTRKSNTNSSNVVFGKDETKHLHHPDANVGHSSNSVPRNKSRMPKSTLSHPPKNEPHSADNNSRKSKNASRDHRPSNKHHGVDSSKAQVSNDSHA